MKTNLTADRHCFSVVCSFQHFPYSLNKQEQIGYFSWCEVRKAWYDACRADEDVCSWAQRGCTFIACRITAAVDDAYDRLL